MFESDIHIYLNMSEFTILDRVLNISHTIHREVILQKGFLEISIAFNYFRKTLHLKSLRGFWYVSGFRYVGVLNIPGLLICQILNFQGYTEFNYFRKYDRVLNIREDLIMEGLLNIPGLCQVFKYANATQGPEYGWIMSEETVRTMAGFRICLFKVSQGWECNSGSTYASLDIQYDKLCIWIASRVIERLQA